MPPIRLGADRPAESFSRLRTSAVGHGGRGLTLREPHAHDAPTGGVGAVAAVRAGMPLRRTSRERECDPVGLRRMRTRKTVGGVVALAAVAAGALVAVTLTAGTASAGTGTGYLHTNGNKIVDSTGATVR